MNSLIFIRRSGGIEMFQNVYRLYAKNEEKKHGCSDVEQEVEETTEWKRVSL